jgi:hypothetical protein
LYIGALNNKLISELNLRMHAEFLSTIQKLKTIPEKYPSACSENVHLMIFERAHINELAFYINRCEFEKGMMMTGEIEEGLQRFSGKINRSKEFTLYYGMAYLFFGHRQYPRALAWLNKILNHPEIAVRPDLHCFSRILNLVIHFEMGNEEVMDYLVRSTYRFLYKRKRLYRFEETVLDFIRKKLPKVFSRNDLTEAFKQLKDRLEKVFENEFEKQALGYFDFLSWLKSKIENRTFEEVYRERVLRQQV